MSVSKRRVRYVPSFRRRREGKTDYGKRKAAVVSRTVLVAPRVSGKNITVQFILPSLSGDRTLASSHSRELSKYGWKGSGKSLSAAYLTGLLAGFKGGQRKLKKAFLYTGVGGFVKGSRVASAVKGVVDAGVEVPAAEDGLPSQERIRGEHVAEYARSLSKVDEEALRRRFSKIIGSRLKPIDYPKHFDAARKKILGEFKGER